MGVEPPGCALRLKHRLELLSTQSATCLRIEKALCIAPRGRPRTGDDPRTPAKFHFCDPSLSYFELIKEAIEELKGLLTLLNPSGQQYPVSQVVLA